MVSLETVQPAVNKSTTMDQPTSSPRISFSSEFLDENNFISISPNHRPREIENQKPPLSPSPIRTAADLQFEFLSNTGPAAPAGHAKMLTADELFFEGKLLPFWQMQQQSERLHKISLNCDDAGEAANPASKEENAPTGTRAAAVNWFVDDDPSPRPPNCTVLWKELLRLKKKQRAAASLSPSSSSSSNSSSSSSLADAAVAAEEKKEKKKKGEKLESKSSNNTNQVKRAAKRGLERTRSASIRIRPMINVPICSQRKSSSALPPFFPLKKVRVVER
ncbi:unnamed protein product [Linum tenue]|uniref:Uncharacterized protein n=2 Tax=Linum tenue TaxID=586396 RepID=A0AAV0L5E2_9ROSI|nr:unnamed protein product [Linum tenue]